MLLTDINPQVFNLVKALTIVNFIFQISFRK